MEEHAWLVPTVTRLVDLLRYPDRANEFGSRKITVRAARAALLVLMKGVIEDAPPPRLEPTADGGLRFEWLEYWVDVVLLVGPNGDVKVTITIQGNSPQPTEMTEEKDAAALLEVGLSRLVGVVKDPPPRLSRTTAAVPKVEEAT